MIHITFPLFYSHISSFLTVEKDAHQFVFSIHCFADLICLHIRVISCNIWAMKETQAEQLICTVEDCFSHSVEVVWREW